MSSQHLQDTFSLEVNGNAVTSIIEDRTSIADLLRDELDLTGTHLGCEQGVCGACTIEIDGVPSRSCITQAKACNNTKIRTIEGYDDDLIMSALRESFSEHHALQCGFCTPGMLVASYDIVSRGVAANESDVRTALSGNLCRCTGYQGIVKAVMSVLARRSELLTEESKPAIATAPSHEYRDALPVFKRTVGKVDQVTLNISSEGGDNCIIERIKFKHSIEDVWALMRDVEQVVPCVPGASLLGREGEKLEIQMEASFGAISAKFQGNGLFCFDDKKYSGRFEGEGKDTRSGSGASGALDFQLIAEDEKSCWLHLEASYEVTGSLSQFSRGGLIKSFASAVTRMFTDNLSLRLKGEVLDPSKGAKLSIFRLVLAVLQGWFKR